ncbi:MAG: hypothetical protein ACI4Q6_09575 [Huintestinicola sp.]
MKYDDKSSPGIEVLDLDMRTFNHMKRAGINTLADIEKLENYVSNSDMTKLQISDAHLKAIEAYRVYRESQTQQKTPAEITDIPALSETASEVADSFNYALLSVELGDYLKRKEEQLKNEYMNFTANCGRIFAEAQEKLAKHGFGDKNGVFEKWITSMGFKKSTVYEMIKIHQFRSSEIRTNEQAQLFDGLSKSLQYEIAKPSAPPELVEQVMSGDITTHKKYIELKKQLDNIKEDLEISKMEAEHCEERAAYAEEQVTKLSVKNTELANQIKELESRPIDVATPDDEELDRMARERAQGLLRAKDTEWQKRLDEVQLQLRDVQSKLLDSAFEANTPDMEQLKEFYEYLHGNALSAIKSCFDFIHGGKVTGSAAADIKARLRSLKEVINDYLEEMK